MKERPILFNGDMVRAILAGRKTQTRRVVKPEGAVHITPFVGSDNKRTGEYGWHSSEYLISKHIFCPYGQPGDRLWVRERCKYEDIFYKGNDLREGCFRARIEYYADNSIIERDVDVEHWSCACEMNTDKWHPSIHMPRWASRITLEVTDVRVQRLQEISEEDALAEGVETVGRDPDGAVLYRDYFSDDYAWSAGESFISLWHTLHGFKGPNAWSFNPWVWAMSFKVV